MRALRTAIAALACAAFVSSVATIAHAQASPEDVALAETLFRDGRALLEAGKTDAACTKLEASQKLDPRVSTMLNVAACHELQGRTASAWAEFLEAARLARAQTVKDAKVLEDTARARADALAPKIHRIKVDATAQGLPPDLEVSIDGRVLPPAALQSPIPIDPGAREIAARASGYKPWSTQVTIAGPPGVHDVAIPKLAPAPVTKADPGPVTGPAPTKGEEPPPSRIASAPFIIGATVGVVGIGLGSFFGVRAISQKSDRDKDCDISGCGNEGLAKQSDARTSALASTIAFAVGGAGAVFAIIWAVRPQSRASVSATPTAGAFCTHQGCAATLQGRF